MFEQLRCAVAQVRRLVAELEPDTFDGPGARRLVELFDEVERLGAAGRRSRPVRSSPPAPGSTTARIATPPPGWPIPPGATVGAAPRPSTPPLASPSCRAPRPPCATVRSRSPRSTPSPTPRRPIPAPRPSCSNVRSTTACAACATRPRGEGGCLRRTGGAVRAHSCGAVAAAVDRSRRHRPHRHPRSGRRHRQGHGRARAVRAELFEDPHRGRRASGPTRSRSMRWSRSPVARRPASTTDDAPSRHHGGARRLRARLVVRRRAGRGVRDRRRRAHPGVGRAAAARRLVPQGAARRRHRRARGLAPGSHDPGPAPHRDRGAPARVRRRGLPRHPATSRSTTTSPSKKGVRRAGNLDRLCGHHSEHKHGLGWGARVHPASCASSPATGCAMLRSAARRTRPTWPRSLSRVRGQRPQPAPDPPTQRRVARGPRGRRTRSGLFRVGPVV